MGLFKHSLYNLQQFGMQRLLYTCRQRLLPARDCLVLTLTQCALFAVSADSTARVWDMEIGDCVLLLGGHAGPLTNVAAAADGSVLITTSSDGTARVWELEKGDCLHTLTGHTAAVRLDVWVFWTPCTNSVPPFDFLTVRTFVGRLNSLYEHGWASWQKLTHSLPCSQVNCAAVDAEGRLAITGSADGTGRVWDLLSAQCIHILSGHEHSSGHASGRPGTALPACKHRGDTGSSLLSA